VALLAVVAIGLIAVNAQEEVAGLNPGIKVRIHERFL